MKMNKSSKAIVITVIDAFVNGWAKVIYLYTMLKLEPVSPNAAEPVEGTVAESAT